MSTTAASAAMNVTTKALRCPFIGAKVLNNIMESPATAEIMVKTCPFLGRVCGGKGASANASPKQSVAPYNITMDVSQRFIEKCPFSKVMGDKVGEFLNKPVAEESLIAAESANHSEACELLSVEDDPATFEVSLLPTLFLLLWVFCTRKSNIFCLLTLFVAS